MPMAASSFVRYLYTYGRCMGRTCVADLQVRQVSVRVLYARIKVKGRVKIRVKVR